ncbi:glycoside hydrolase family 2 protein [Gordonia polyisoprenivorans]|uniref:glycoside hydrolase family 2 protein n=1 Tax=Gordonia polyisoprenivorans TaxID=84595 RepID=UPI0019E704CA|nr:glycoside hydrolase family 2 protein [Gordonia polyisoprenivorans]MBE7193474.1 hypothetical protein [Gordonia polyisoprenivorans]WCB38618.1 hypothetical protein PHA63_05580 [Gordonia polyisoprenivorans]
MVEARWRLVRGVPSAEPDPAVLDDATLPSMEIAAPGPVGHLVAGSELEAADPDTVDDSDWWLVAMVTVERSGVVDFQGLTPPGAVFVDRVRVADVESMFLPVRCPMTAGTHEIAIWSGSLRTWLSRRRPRGRWRSTLVSAQGMRWARTSLIGRAPVYGGVPPVVGAWRPVVVRPGPQVDLCSVGVDSDTGRVDMCARWTGAEAPDVATAEVLDEEGATVAVGDLSARAGSPAELVGQVALAEPRRWYPHGYGAPSTYLLRITAGGVSAERRIGFRTVRATCAGGAFRLSVNGIDVFCRGAVWVPPDPRAMTVDREVIREQLLVLRDAGANMVRVMGGFTPEQAEFYELCAELGMLVWQDAMLTTFDPPEDLDDVVCAEVDDLLTRHAGNPALAVVSGGSETLQQPEMMGVATESLSLPLIETKLRGVVERVSGVPYVVASPSSWSDDTEAPTPLAIRSDNGIAHWFGVGGYMNGLDDVRTAGVRFAAESLAFAIPASDEAVESDFGSLGAAGQHPDWKRGVPRDRTASWDFEDVRDFYVREVFGVDPLQVRRVDPGRYLQLGRLAVAEAMVNCYRFWRRPDSGCAGALVLNAKDLRPGAGWGLLDHRGTAKLPLAALARVWAPVALTIDNCGQRGLRIDLHNDTADELAGIVRLRAVDDAGRVVVEGESAIVVEPRSSVTRADADLTGAFTDLSHAYRFGPPVAAAVLVEFVVGEQVMRRDALIVAPLAAPIRSGLRAQARTDDAGGWLIDVRAETSLRYVCLNVPGWVLSDNCFHLVAEHTHTIRATPADGTAPQASGPRGAVSSIDARETVAVVAPAVVASTAVGPSAAS